MDADSVPDQDRLSDILDRPNSCRCFQLKNGVRALVFRDDRARAMSAALDIHVGHFDSPKDFPGVPNLAQRLLSSRTVSEARSGESFQQYVERRGGFASAFTENEDTVFDFRLPIKRRTDEEVNEGSVRSLASESAGEELFHEALCKFASMFLDFESVRWEIDAAIAEIDSMHERNKQNDSFRVMQLARSLTEADHPFHMFPTGSKQTLSTKGVDMAVSQFMTSAYVGRNMAISVSGPFELDLMESWVRSAFTGIAESGPSPVLSLKEALTMPKWRASPKYVSAISAQARTRTLHLCWIIPPQGKHYLTKPFEFVRALFTSNHRDGLQEHLRQRDMASWLDMSCDSQCASFDLLRVSIGLTESADFRFGMIVAIVFAYIRKILDAARSAEVCASLFREFAVVAEREGYSSASFESMEWLHESSASMHRRSEEVTLSAMMGMRAFNRSAVVSLLEALTADKARLIMMEGKALRTVRHKQSEPYYQTEFSPQKILSSNLRLWNNFESPHTLYALKASKLHSIIPFRTESRQKTANEAQDPPYPGAPTLLSQSPGAYKLYLKRTGVGAGVTVCISLESPELSYDVKTSVACVLLCNIFLVRFRERAARAATVGLGMTFKSENESLRLAFHGNMDNIGNFVREACRLLADLVPEQNEFDQAVENMRDSLSSYEHVSPLARSSYSLSYVLDPTAFHSHDRIESLHPESFCFEDVIRVRELLLRSFFVKVLVHGNVSRQWSEHLCSAVVGFFSSDAPETPRISRNRTLVLPSSCDHVVRQGNGRRLTEAAACVLWVTGSSHVPRTVIASLLLCHLLDSSASVYLRKSPDPNRFVQARLYFFGRYVGILMSTASRQVNAEDLLEQTSSFAETFGSAVLAKTDEAALQALKQRLLAECIEGDRDFGTRTAGMWRSIVGASDEGCPLSDSSLVATALEEVSLENVADLYSACLHGSGAIRRRFTSLCCSEELIPEDKKDMYRQGRSAVDRLNEVKDSLQLATQGGG